MPVHINTAPGARLTTASDLTLALAHILLLSFYFFFLSLPYLASNVVPILPASRAS
jgi:hypothetical protein